MAKKSNGVNKSEEVRQLLKANPALTAKEAMEKLAEKGIKISNALFYYTKGQMKGRKARKKKDQNTLFCLGWQPLVQKYRQHHQVVQVRLVYFY